MEYLKESFNDAFMFGVRWGLSLLAIYGAIILFLISALLLKTRLAKHMKNLGFSMLLFGLARVLAAILDALVIMPFGVFSTFVTYAYWTWIDYFLTTRYFRLKSSAVGIEGRERIAANYDEILDDIDRTRQKLIISGT